MSDYTLSMEEILRRSFNTTQNALNVYGAGGATGYPEVATYGDLPSAAGNPGAIYYVQQSTGLYLLNRKAQGLYYSDGSGWASAGDVPSFFADNNFKVYNNTTTDAQVKIDASLVTSGNTRSIIMPDRDVLLGSIVCESTTTTATSSNVGLLRYVTSGNNSYLDAVMQTAGSSYEWVNIVQNNYGETYSVEYLVVAGGGAGACQGGGGGAGGLLNDTMTVTPGVEYEVTVGGGGTGSKNNTSAGATNGSDSIFHTITAVGGGYGANEGVAANDGGCGGGGCYYESGATLRAGGSGTASQGNDGGTTGTSGGSPYPGSGGGGAGEAGHPGSTDVGVVGGFGGDGLEISITGTPTYYAGGGGACSHHTLGEGGLGGGGDGGQLDLGSGIVHPTAGDTNTGGGGGAETNSGPGAEPRPYAGANGGSGVVILRFLTSSGAGYSTTGSPTVTTDGAYTVVKYTGAGTFTA